MFYLIETYWIFFVVAAIAGAAVGYWTSSAKEPLLHGFGGWLPWVSIAFVVGLIAAIFGGLPDRAGLYLETLLGVVFSYVVGHLGGGLLRKVWSFVEAPSTARMSEAPAPTIGEAPSVATGTAAQHSPVESIQAAEVAHQTVDAKVAEDARRAADAKAAEDARWAVDAKAAEDARRAADAKAAEDARRAVDAKAAEDARRAVDAKAAEDARRVADAKAAEDARPAVDAKAAEDARRTADVKAVEDARRAADAKTAQGGRRSATMKAAGEPRRPAAAETRRTASAKNERRVAKEADETRRAVHAKAAEEVRRAADAEAAAETRRAADERARQAVHARAAEEVHRAADVEARQAEARRAAAEAARQAVHAQAAKEVHRAADAEAAAEARRAADAKATVSRRLTETKPKEAQHPTRSKPAEAPRPAPRPPAIEPVRPAKSPAPASRVASGEPSKPVGIDAPLDGKADDLKLIKGIGAKNEKVCNDLGIYHFAQIADWSSEEAAWIGQHMEFPGRVEREYWIGQAKLLASGGDTEHSTGVKAGTIALDERADAPLDEAETATLRKWLPEQAARVENEARHAGRRPYGLLAPRDGQRDNLKRIRGIGPQNEGRLNGIGVWHYGQIAAWSAENLKWIASYLAASGRIEREKWIEQAKELAAGRGTQASRRTTTGKNSAAKTDNAHGPGNPQVVEPHEED
jgi:predicted flap endonuclease-1-like 5' DNA nuclease